MSNCLLSWVILFSWVWVFLLFNWCLAGILIQLDLAVTAVFWKSYPCSSDKITMMLHHEWDVDLFFFGQDTAAVSSSSYIVYYYSIVLFDEIGPSQCFLKCTSSGIYVSNPGQAFQSSYFRVCLRYLPIIFYSSALYFLFLRSLILWSLPYNILDTFTRQ